MTTLGELFYTIEDDRCQSDSAVDELCPPEESEACFLGLVKALMPDSKRSACGVEGGSSDFESEEVDAAEDPTNNHTQLRVPTIVV